jgi:U3 small nucleolar RNA-associated protein 10
MIFLPTSTTFQIEQSLLEPMWKDAELNLAASVVASFLSSLTKFPDEQFTPTFVKGARSVVDALRGACATGCDAGITHAVTALCESSNQPAIRRRLVLVLGLSEDGGRSCDSNEMGTDSVHDRSSVPLLPPRVALEHADASSRLNAIDRLMKEPTLADSGGESLEQALLRHFLTEDELDVTVAAGTALATLLGSRPFNVSLKFAEDCFEALRLWTLDENSIRTGGVSIEESKKRKKHKDKKKSKRNVSEGKETIVAALSDERVRVLELALEIAGYTVRSLLTADRRHDTDDFDIVQEQLIQGIIAHLDLVAITEKETKSTHGERIVQALFHAIGASKQRKTALEDVLTVLITTERLLSGLRSCWTNSNIRQRYNLSSDFALFRRYFNVYLTVLTYGLDQSGSSQSRELLLARVSDALSASLFMVGWKGESDKVVIFDKKETESLVRCLGACATLAQTIEASVLLNAVVELSSVPSEDAYNNICLPSINRLCDEYAAVHGVSKLVILMEAALRPGVSGPAILRLLSLASDCVSSDRRTPAPQVADIIIFVLALFGHSDQTIRQAALRLVSVLKEVTTASQGGALPEDEAVVRDYVSFLVTDASNASSFASSIIVDGSSSLPAFLGGSLLKSKDPCRLKIEVLRSCCRTACSTYASNDTSDGKKRWLSFEEGAGGCRAASLILSALELSGEATSPLVDRYKYAGRGVLDVLLEACKDSSCREVTTSIADLIHSVARMVKGVTVVDASSVDSDMSALIISTGPNARGTRARSYSVGRSVGVSFIEPYPKDMYDDIIRCLSFRDVEAAGTDAVKNEVCRAVVNEVLGSQSWVDGVFKKMDRGSRRELLSSLLSLRMTEAFDCAGEAFLGLPADGTDVARLIRGEGAEKPNIASFIFLSDYIHIHSERLRDGPGYSELVSLLFQTLEMVSSNEYLVDDLDEKEFARQCLLSSLAGLVPAEAASDKDERKHKLPKKHLTKYASMLGVLVGDTDTRSDPVRPLPLGRPRTLAFSLLTSLCSLDPSSIVASLVPAMLASIVVQSDSDVANHPPKRGFGAPGDAFLSVVPVFAKYSNAANSTLFDLFGQFLAKCSEVSDERDKMELYSCMVDAIVAISPEYFDSITPFGSFVAAFLAFDVRNDGPVISRKTLSSTVVATDILRFAPPITQVAALIQLIGYTNSFLLKISGADDYGDHRKMSMDCSMADLEDPYARSVTMSILTVVLNSLQSAPVTKFVRKCNGMESKLSLRLWQDLLIVQSTSMQAQGRVHQKLKRTSNAADSETEDGGPETNFWNECQSVIDTSLELVQNLLPAHLFLASVASLIQDSTDSELCSRAIRFVSERVAEIDADSPESSLFLDLLPMLVALLDSSSEAAEQAEQESTILVQQSVLVAVETLARLLCLQSSQDTSGRLNSFTMVLNHASLLIKTHSAPFEVQGQVIPAVVCSAALCASTLVRVLKARSLPLLPNLIEPLLAVLSSINFALSRNPSHWSATDRGQAVLLQLSILSALLAIADSLPQFLGAYLGRLLSPSVLLSLSLRSESSEHQVAVNSTTTQLEAVLSRKIPARQLIPSLCKLVPECKRNGELQALLAMLKESVQQAPRSELPSLRSWILWALTLAYEFRGGGGGGGDDDESVDLVDEANGVLLAVVMKLSESQLRPLYVKLREWRGDVVSEPEDEDVALKRRAFWSLSAVLSTELRGIFLPCLSTAVSDSVNDLVSEIVLFLALEHLG